MAASDGGAQLRKDLSAFRRRSRRGSYPGELRARAVVYVSERVRGGATAAEIATELGVREVTASRWSEKAGAGVPPRKAAAACPSGLELSLIPLVVRGQPVDASRPRLRVDFVDGTRVHASGLVLSDVVEAIQALRSPR